MAPRLSQAADGVMLSWLEPTERGHKLMWSRWRGHWTEAHVVVERDGMFANWADVPGVVEGGDGALYAHWLRRSGASPYAYDIAMLRSLDGLTWADLGKLNDDDVQGEHGFVSYVPIDTGVRAYWLDGRDAGAHMMSLRTSTVGERVAPSTIVDSSVCDCCNTAATMTDSGPMVAYRDRTRREVRDIWVAGGGRDEPSPVHRDDWVIHGCPVNGPAIEARDGLSVVAWFTAGGGSRCSPHSHQMQGARSARRS